jgi:hypothetical protein
MTPRQDWFYLPDIPVNTTSDSYERGYPPHIIIDWYLSNEAYLHGANESLEYNHTYSLPHVLPGYWYKLSAQMLETENVFHRFHDGDGWLSVNTTTVLDRNINDSNWTIGGTPFAGLVYHDRFDAYNPIIDAKLYNKTSASCPDTNNMFVGEFPGIESHTVCRTRMKQHFESE